MQGAGTGSGVTLWGPRGLRALSRDAPDFDDPAAWRPCTGPVYQACMSSRLPVMRFWVSMARRLARKA